MTDYPVGFNPTYAEAAPSLETLESLKGQVLLEFGAPWCSHCQAAATAVQGAFSDHPELVHIKVYDGKGKRLGRQFRVKLWPTLILLCKGQELARLVRPLRADQVRSLLTAES